MSKKLTDNQKFALSIIIAMLGACQFICGLAVTIFGFLLMVVQDMLFGSTVLMIGIAAMMTSVSFSVMFVGMTMNKGVKK